MVMVKKKKNMVVIMMTTTMMATLAIGQVLSTNAIGISMLLMSILSDHDYSIKDNVMLSAFPY